MFFHVLAAIKNGFVLSDCRDDVIAFAAIRLNHSLYGEVVTLRGAGGEDNFLSSSADGRSNLAAGCFDGACGFPAKRMAVAGGIAKLRSKKRQHGLKHTRINRRRRSEERRVGKE